MMSNNLSCLNLKEKIGQLIMPGIHFSDEGSLENAMHLVEEYGIGGFIIFDGEKGHVKECISELNKISEIPLLFSCDAERGLGQVLAGGTIFPFSMALAAIRDLDLVYNQARFIAGEMIEYGLNLIFAPVTDVNINPENPIINIRSYGDDPSHVSSLAVSFIRGCQDHGMLSCGKHFPGHGSVQVDSHVELPVVSRSLEELESCELVPFKDAIDAGVESIMIGHLSIPELDNSCLPAPFSKKVINSLLREKLGFKNLVITDSLKMGALTRRWSQSEIAIKCLGAGCDILLDPLDSLEVINSLEKVVKQDINLSNLLDYSVNRILSCKMSIKTDERNYPLIKESDGKQLVKRISERSVCKVKGTLLNTRKISLYIFDMAESGGNYKIFEDTVSKLGIAVKGKYFFQEGNNDSIRKPEKDEGIVCLVYTKVAAWSSFSKLPASAVSMINVLTSLECEKALISFGSPYVVRGFNGFDIILCSFDFIDECQIAVANCLVGKSESSGQMPVNL